MQKHKPVLAVLPFRVASGAEADTILAEGLVDDLSGSLTRFAGFETVAPMSGSAVAELADREAAARLGASHLLRGRFQCDGERVRVTTSLIDGGNGAQVWSETLDTPAASVFALQDELVGRISATLIARMEEAALQAARRKPPESLAAYELTLRGMALLKRGTTDADEQARSLFQQALEIDPHYARAHAGLSLSWFNEWSCQFWNRFTENRRLAYEHAHRALEIDDSDAMLHLIVGRVLLYQRHFEQASWYFDRALALCPNDVETLIQLSFSELYLGRPEVGLAHAEKAMRLNPYHPNYYYAYAAVPHFTMRNFEKALEIGSMAVGVPIVDAPCFAAVALARLNRMDEARQRFELFKKVFRDRITYGREPEPGECRRWLSDVNPFRRQQDLELLLDGVAELGGDDGTGSPGASPARHPGIAHATGFVRCDGGWRVDFAGRRAILPDLKGLEDIRRLLERPDEDVHCLDLAGREVETYSGDALLDGKARQSLKARILDLQEELAEAEYMNDPGRAERAREELDTLVETLSNALGLRGRERRLGSMSERARTAVTWRIRHAIRKVEALHPELAGHLGAHIRTGTFCVYRPRPPIDWRFAGD
jgi:TolB-like protein/Tfp pilus assembly protein PilF